MKTVLTALMAVLALSVMSATADAEKKCKAGFEYDPDRKKCVASDGS